MEGGIQPGRDDQGYVGECLTKTALFRDIIFMRRLFIILITIAMPFNIYAQGDANTAPGKLRSSITVGYGIGNIWKTYLEKTISVPGYNISSSGPVILIYEYAISKRFSAGISGSYSLVKGKYSKPNFEFNDKLTILTLLARVNYHLWTTRKLDPYFGGGIGLNNSKYRNSESFNANAKEPSTFDYSGQLGLKYWPHKNLGLYAEAGYVGGSFVQLGLTGKF